MAPTTRLTLTPARRVQYNDVLRGKQTLSASSSPAPAGRVTKHRGKRAKSKRKECVICAGNKTVGSFKIPEGEALCAHFRDTCTGCVSKMIKSKIANGELRDGVLACPFPDCEVVVGFEGVKGMVSRGLFATWDKALLTNLTASSANFIACLNTDCGCAFSIEDWTAECKKKKKIACPYCNAGMCIACSRPWHTGKGCDAAKAEEEQRQTESRIKAMGAKPCPGCGIRISKKGGCDHMTCKRCGYHFCWRCSVQFTANMQHAQGCPHANRDIAAEPGNFFDGPLNAAVALIANRGARQQRAPQQNHAPGNIPGAGQQQVAPPNNAPGNNNLAGPQPPPPHNNVPRDNLPQDNAAVNTPRQDNAAGNNQPQLNDLPTFFDTLAQRFRTMYETLSQM